MYVFDASFCYLTLNANMSIIKSFSKKETVPNPTLWFLKSPFLKLE